MKVLGIDHVGIAVQSLDQARELYEGVLGLQVTKTEEVREQQVKVMFIPTGDSEIELLESTDPEGPIAKFVAAKGAGMRHIALRVENVEAAIADLRAKGIRMIDETPRYGAGGARIAFVHPKATNGTLVELCERPS